MKSAPTFLFFVLVSTAFAREKPLGKVIQLLDDLTAKIIKEGEDEAKAYHDYFEWCDDASKNFGFDIETANAEKAKLEALIAKSMDDSEASAGKIEELSAHIATDERDLKDATLIRKKEAADFAAEEANLLEILSALTRAFNIIEREMAKNPAAFAQVDVTNFDGLVQALAVVVDAASLESADKQKLMAFVQSQQSVAEDDDAPGAPAAAVYKTHSTNILDVLLDLKEKAEEQLASLRKAESNTKHNFDILKQSLEDQVGQDSKNMA